MTKLTARRKNRSTPALVLAVCLESILLAAGCGSGASPCGEPPPTCSSTPEGSFVLTAICGVWPLGCTEASNSVSNHEASGTLTINADGTGSLNLDLEYSYSVSVPASCGESCAELDETIGLCDPDGDKCSCGGTAGMGMSGSFTWRLEGVEVVLEFNSQDETGTFCQSGEIARSHTSYDGLELLWGKDAS